MKEIVLTFGAHDQLVGILSLPDRPDAAALPVIVPNTGLEHRVGPNRLHVHLCRALADMGFPALRLDMSAMGDSAASDGAPADSTDDLRAAMDALQAQGLGDRFIVVGLCSGAHDAHLLIRADSRAVGGALIDGYVYPTVRYRLTYLAQRILDPVRIVRRLFRTALPLDEAGQREGAKDDIEYYRQPSLEQMRGDLAAFMVRGLSLIYIYTGQIQNKYNYADQLVDALPELRAYPRAEVHYLAMADHTFSRISMRSELLDVVSSWVRKCASTQAQ